MLQLLRRYLRLMKSHDFSYCYSDDHDFYCKEDQKRIAIIGMRMNLVLTPRGRWFVAKAEKRYGNV